MTSFTTAAIRGDTIKSSRNAQLDQQAVHPSTAHKNAIRDWVNVQRFFIQWTQNLLDITHSLEQSDAAETINRTAGTEACVGTYKPLLRSTAVVADSVEERPALQMKQAQTVLELSLETDTGDMMQNKAVQRLDGFTSGDDSTTLSRSSTVQAEGIAFPTQAKPAVIQSAPGRSRMLLCHGVSRAAMQ